MKKQGGRCCLHTWNDWCFLLFCSLTVVFLSPPTSVRWNCAGYWTTVKLCRRLSRRGDVCLVLLTPGLCGYVDLSRFVLENGSDEHFTVCIKWSLLREHLIVASFGHIIRHAFNEFYSLHQIVLSAKGDGVWLLPHLVISYDMHSMSFTVCIK